MKTPFDQWPAYESALDRSPNHFRTVEKDDFQEFTRSHRGHRLEDLQILEDSYVSEKPYAEPINVCYFKATNGRERFVIKKYRENIEEPLRYQVIPGDYSLKCSSIEIQSKAIRKQLEAEFRATPLIPAKIAAFLRLFRHIAQTADPTTLEAALEESPHPLQIYYKIDDVSLAFLLRNCRNIFRGKEYTMIEDFVLRHREEGVLLLKGTYKIQLIDSVKPQPTVGATPTALCNAEATATKK